MAALFFLTFVVLALGYEMWRSDQVGSRDLIKFVISQTERFHIIFDHLVCLKVLRIGLCWFIRHMR